MANIPFFKKPSPDIRGFDGLMMMTTIACAAMGVGYLYSMAKNYLPYFKQFGFSFSTKLADISDVFRTYEFLCYVVIVLILLLTAFLLFRESPYLIKFVNIAYPIYMVLFIVIYFIGAKVFAAEYNLDFFWGLLQSMILPVLVMLYINKSLRIKNTIFNKDIDYVKLAKEKQAGKNKNKNNSKLQSVWKEANAKVTGKKK
jgi:peptidoglycan/LPS O-acetylase OafA/YrhL